MDYQKNYRNTLHFADQIHESISKLQVPKGLGSRVDRAPLEVEDFNTVKAKYINLVRDMFTPTQDEMGIEEEPFTADTEFPTAAQSADLNYGSSQLMSGVYAADDAGVEAILATIRQKESGGNYTVKNPKPGQTASGGYQFINSTWRSLTKKYGVGTQYKSAKDAPPEVQDAVARAHVKEILANNNNDVTKVPLVWYTGNAQGKISQEAIDINNGLTPAKYQAMWMKSYNKNAGRK
jgi:Transglycosylase-like domain